MSRYIDAYKLNGYKLGLISPKAQYLFHEIINNAPTEDVKPIVYGEWIDNMDLGYHVSICSNCNWRGHGDTCLIYKPNYCPNCGAKMDGKESEDKE